MHNRHATVAPELRGYRAEELIGRGGTGEVYRALDVRLERQVALKVLAAGVAADERFRDRFLSESRLAASLDHPNVIPIYEAGEQDERLFIAMRYVRGKDLKALLRRQGALDSARTVAIARQLAGALDAAHRAGLVHRDVKPSNVLLDSEEGREHCYLADFGLTQSATERGPTDGQFMGTVAYVSPEQIRGEQVDGRADQYGLACLIFECLTGSVPYGSRSEVATIFAHLQEPVPKPSERADLPAALDEVIARGMAKAPDDRYESCTALVEAATDALELRPTERASRPRLVVALAAAVLALAAILAVSLLAAGGEDSRTSPAGGLVRIDPDTNRVTRETGIRGHPGELVVTPGGVWMADFRGGVLWRYEPGSGRLERVTSTGEPRDLAAVGDKVYVGADTAFLRGVVSRYDARTGVREEGIGLLACAMGAGEGVLWAANCPFAVRVSTDGGRLRKIVTRYLPFRDPLTVDKWRGQFRELAVGAGSVWVLGDALDRRLWRLDARSGEVEATVELSFAPTSVAVADDRVWITDGVRDAVVPLDVNDERLLRPVRVGRGPSGITAGAGSIWVANTLDGTVSRIDPESRRVTATAEVGGAPRGLAVGGGGVWVTQHDF
jgi:YVTN family beta-propeller protein